MLYLRLITVINETAPDFILHIIWLGQSLVLTELPTKEKGFGRAVFVIQISSAQGFGRCVVSRGIRSPKVVT